MKFYTPVFIVISTLAAGSVQLMGQTTYQYFMSTDTLVAGDTTAILCNIGFIADHDKLQTLLHLNTYDENCDNYGDTIHHIDSEQYDDTIISVTFFIPPGTCSSKYQLWITDPTHPDIKYIYDSITILNPPGLIQSPVDQQICQGEEATVTSGFSDCKTCQYQWFKNNDSIHGANQPDLILSNFSPSDTGSYYCAAFNQWGTVSTDIARLEILSVPGKPSIPEGISTICQGIVSTGYHIPAMPDVTLYTWSLFPPEAGILDYTDTTADVTWDQDFSGHAKLLVKVKNGNCRGPNSDTLDIFIAGPQEGPEICIVGVDAESGKNLVVWEKLPGSAILNYIIYRETNQAGIYLPLDTIDADEISVYVDATSTPEWVSQRYKLSLIDTCGFESELSTPHKTIHLTNNMAAIGKVNLIWDGYEGFAFLSYNLYHGPHPDSMGYINTVPSNVFIYSNIVPCPGDNFFQIEAIHPEGCTPSLKSINYGSSRSNILYVETEEVIEGISEQPDSDITIFPSPARDMVTIAIPNYKKPVRAMLVNVSGQLLQEFIIESGSYELDISSFPEGLYILHLNKGNNSLKAKIIKSR